MKTLLPTLLAGALLLPSCALADVSYQETTEITGGSMVGMMKMAGAFSSAAKRALSPTTSNVMIQGSRMVQVDPHNTVIIDLDAQTITNIDHDKRSYSVVTFQQMQQAMADAAAKMKNSKQPTSANASQLTFDAHISTTGATREINGATAHETLLTLTMLSNGGDPSVKAGMAATSEMWLIKDAPGMAEMKRFNERMAKELAVDMNASAMTSMLAAEPGGAQALEQLKKESAKVTGGYPVLQVTRVGMSVDGKPLAAPSVAPLPQQSQNENHGSVAGDMGKEVAVGTATQEASSGLSRLGGLGRALGSSGMGSMLGHMPSSKPASASAPATPADPATAGVLMENQTATSGFSVAPVDANSFAIPAGYKLVASPLQPNRSTHERQQNA